MNQAAGRGGAANPSAAGGSDREGRAKRLAMALILAPVLATLLWAVAARLTRAPEREEARPPVGAGLPAPAFTFPRLGGGAMGLADLRGKTVLINVWATWCPPCLEEMPDLQKLYVRMRRDGEPFEILAVSIDALGGDVVQKFVDRFGLTFPILLDPRGRIKKLYATTGVPETFIVDGGGNIVQKIIGPRKWAAPDAVSFLKKVIRSGGRSAGKTAPAS